MRMKIFKIIHRTIFLKSLDYNDYYIDNIFEDQLFASKETAMKHLRKILCVLIENEYKKYSKLSNECFDSEYIQSIINTVMDGKDYKGDKLRVNDDICFIERYNETTKSYCHHYFTIDYVYVKE